MIIKKKEKEISCITSKVVKCFPNIKYPDRFEDRE
jgi:hypothetical protein